MRSAVAFSSEIDDLELAVKELTSQIRGKLAFGRNSIAIVYCDADVEVDELGKRLREELGFDVAGLTTTATVDRNNGYNDMGILLSVLTGDDVTFSPGCSGEIDAGNLQDSVKGAYVSARAKLAEDPKLILVLSPYFAEISSENYMSILNETSGGVPIFGGVATDHYDLQFQKTFFNGQAYLNGLVFVLISGGIKPLFAMEHRFGAKVEKKGVITESGGNFIYRVGEQTFKEFVASMVPVPDEELVVYHFQSTPFVMELPDFEKDEEPVVRALCTIDHTTGAGGFLSKMPEGSVIYLNVLQRDNLSESCNGALCKIVEEIGEAEGYKYSMVFVSTCNARHLLMGDTKDLESSIITEKLSELPADLNAVGFYGFGEICPTGKRGDGTAKNRYHNVSFALCAI